MATHVKLKSTYGEFDPLGSGVYFHYYVLEWTDPPKYAGIKNTWYAHPPWDDGPIADIGKYDGVTFGNQDDDFTFFLTELGGQFFDSLTPPARTARVTISTLGGLTFSTTNRRINSGGYEEELQLDPAATDDERTIYPETVAEIDLSDFAGWFDAGMKYIIGRDLGYAMPVRIPDGAIVLPTPAFRNCSYPGNGVGGLVDGNVYFGAPVAGTMGAGLALDYTDRKSYKQFVGPVNFGSGYAMFSAIFNPPTSVRVLHSNTLPPGMAPTAGVTGKVSVKWKFLDNTESTTVLVSGLSMTVTVDGFGYTTYSYFGDVTIAPSVPSGAAYGGIISHAINGDTMQEYGGGSWLPIVPKVPPFQTPFFGVYSNGGPCGRMLPQIAALRTAGGLYPL